MVAFVIGSFESLPEAADQHIKDPRQHSRPHDPHEEEEGDSIEISFHNDNIYWLR